MTDLVRIGSETAKGGFANEKTIAKKFENWRKDKEAKRWVKNYVNMWEIPDNIAILLKIFCGEISPSELLKERKITKQKYDSLRDKRRFFMDEFESKHKKSVVDFFKKNKILVLTDIIKGRDKFSAGWILVT